MTMAEIVLRVRLIGGEHLDVTYEDDGGAPDEVVGQVISTLAEDGFWSNTRRRTAASDWPSSASLGKE